MANNAGDAVSPKPVPQIFNNFSHFTTKKEKYGITPKIRNVPPRPPCKSISKISRLSNSYSLNNSQNDTKAQIISFKKEDRPELSVLYDQSLSESYFKQCFAIEERIGSGSFGDVYKVKSREDGKHYAVKVSREKFKGKLDREEKLNEVFKHEQLPRHDNLVEIYRAWEEKQRLYIQTELCSKSLSAFAESNHEIPDEVIWRYLVDLLKAVHHLHSNDLIHLDIKPENIFISGDDLCKLGDFGLVLDVKNRGHNTEVAEGDPKYLSTEIMQGVYTKSADIFALGMTVLELASDLDLPSRGQGWHMLRSGRIPYNILKKISPDLQTIITLMIDPNYLFRPTTSDLLNHPIIAKYELIRRKELKVKKYLSIIQSIKSAFYNFLMRITSFINLITLPLQNRLSFLFSRATLPSNNDDSSSFNSSPVNYNRIYISNYLDQYSDNESSDDHHRSSSFDSSNSNDDEMFKDNLSSRNLCSTVARNTQSSAISRLSPFFTNNDSKTNNASIQSVTQRLMFDETESDDVLMTENEDDEFAIDSVQSNSVSSANSDVDTNSRFRFRPNMTRKNLSKTFDDLQ